MKLYPVYIIQGAQWGSEGKGQIAAFYASMLNASAVVRTGSINAGHTVYYKDIPYKMQLIPTAWTVEGPMLILGPGCYIHRAILVQELEMIMRATGKDIRERLLIDHRCAIHTQIHEEEAKASGRHHEMGATGKGSSDALMHRMKARGRIPDAEATLFSHNSYVKGWDFSDCICDTTQYLEHSLLRGPVILEGTQGAHLDFYTGPYPYTTNRPVSTAAWLAYAGLSPTLDIRPVLVARTYPIRVAGNSGPMPHETTWTQVYMERIKPYMASLTCRAPNIAMVPFVKYAMELNRLIREGGGPDKGIHEWTEEERYEHRVLISEAPTQALKNLAPPDQLELSRFFEKTTVTNKIRRVARLDIPTLQQAIRWNGCHEMWLTFLNYEFPGVWGEPDPNIIKSGMAGAYLRNLADQLRVPIFGVSTERKPEHHVVVGVTPLTYS